MDLGGVDEMTLALPRTSSSDVIATCRFTELADKVPAGDEDGCGSSAHWINGRILSNNVLVLCDVFLPFKTNKTYLGKSGRVVNNIRRA